MILIFDGGFGTTLSRPPLNIDISKIPLWSSGVLLTHGTAPFAHVYSSFADSGSDVVAAGTYQSYVPAFADALRKGVVPSHDKTSRACDPAHLMQAPIDVLFAAAKNARITPCISLGPLGAFCSPGQEYDGRYPAPFGSAVDVSLQFDPSSLQLQGDSDPLDALTQFHLSRLQSLDLSKNPADSIYLAFETVPQLCEITAIRRAVELWGPPPTAKWFISVPFSPDARYRSAPDLSTADAAYAVFEHAFSGPLPQPWGIGINCTHPSVFPRLVHHLTEKVVHSPVRPWLVMYPDGGLDYDPVKREFTGRPLTQDEFCAHLVDAVRTAGGNWGGLLLGGCCNTDPSHIAALKSAFS